MNVFFASGLLTGQFDKVSNDGISFTLTTKNKDRVENYICVAYGEAAKRLQGGARSGKRLILQGRLGSEKLNTDVYHGILSVSRVLGITDAEAGVDYTYAVIAGEAEAKELAYTGNGAPVVNLSILNKREYKDKEGNVQEYKVYVTGTLWNDRAESLNSSTTLPASFGTVIAGQLKPKSYENKEGKQVNKVDVWVEDLQKTAASDMVSDDAAPEQSAPSNYPARNASAGTVNRRKAF